MSSSKTNSKKNKTISKAEIRFLEAFERLKLNKPELLPKGTPVSQNNVAKEAGVDPSALRSARYPELTESIKQWVDDNKDKPSQISQRQRTLAQRARSRELKERIKDLKEQRDNALSRLVEAQRQIVELTSANESLKSRLPEVNISRLSN